LVRKLGDFGSKLISFKILLMPVNEAHTISILNEIERLAVLASSLVLIKFSNLARFNPAYLLQSFATIQFLSG